jgi:hypothetical protein
MLSCPAPVYGARKVLFRIVQPNVERRTRDAAKELTKLASAGEAFGIWTCVFSFAGRHDGFSRPTTAACGVR